ncbi:hypothetical protein BU24DRAFT_422787 [Aaosphaeria arxii CBS 175.79]|uniref:Uncharacterized protein n=1 Tax=Aaosphaeria arxii CBS 175.79 TaxID=1450172 RepID=A0A6A5XT34_9PLEO|nr:uncharacterized protein BU24DRAFT_422787 [Aaosphaeria arxii CBS 175.79]KAF2016448.1 hypothetical protein BU24DRAFT_422787 [Aaosphaeria arxii CBS 175.79]
MGSKVPYLPAELVSHILKRCTPSTLAAAARCSRQYNNIATPLLYEYIDFDDELDDELDDYEEEPEKAPEKAPLMALAILFSSKPHLAAYVRHLSVRPKYGWPRRLKDTDSSSGSSSDDYSIDMPERTWELENPGELESTDELGSAEELESAEELDRAEELHISEELDRDEDSLSSWESPEGFYSDDDDHSDGPEQSRQVDSILDCCDEERVKQIMEVKNYELLHAVLLPTFPNLVSLDVMDSEYNNHMDRMFIRFGTGAQHGSAFTKLKSLFWCYRMMPCTPAGVIIPPAIFALPVIDKVYLHQARGCGASHEDEDEDEDDAWDYRRDREAEDFRLARLSPRSSTCTHLELRDCRFNKKDLLKIICIPKSLRVFVYELGPWQLGSVSFSTIREGLEFQKDTLEEFCLDYCHNGVGAWRWLEEDCPARSMVLDDFPRLTRLKIASGFVIGIDLRQPSGHTDLWHRRLRQYLPRSIERLQLTHCEVLDNIQILILLDALTDVLIEKARLAPRLYEITLEVTASIVKEQLPFLEQLIRKAADAGTDIVLLNNFKDSADKGRSRKVERKWGFDENIERTDCGDNEAYKPIYEKIVVQTSAPEIS